MVQTKQRQLILEAVRTTNTHPTADELFQIVRRKLPTISLATVYRNLNFLSEIGEIQKLSMPGMPDRFDWKMTPHDHIICDTCGHVHDFSLKNNLKEEIARVCGAQVDGYTLVAHGTCPNCQKNKALAQ